MSMVSQQNQAGISLGEIDRVIAGTHHDPHSILGAHPGPTGSSCGCCGRWPSR